MGCDDYYDPIDDRKRKLWDQNCALIHELNFLGPRGDVAVCCTCSAAVLVGDIHRQDDLPHVRSHREWHDRLGM